MKFIKFDKVYPSMYLDSRIAESVSEVKKMNFTEFNSWLIKLRLNFSDFYSYNLQLYGWDAKEFFLLSNRHYIRKCGIHYFGYSFIFMLLYYKIINSIGSGRYSLLEKLISQIIKKERPEVIFVREQSNINSLFWDQFRIKSLVVCRMECEVQKGWSPMCFDIVYTNIKTYKDFFNSNRIKTGTNFSGFDERILSEIRPGNKLYDVVFVGALGGATFAERTTFFESLLLKSGSKFDFKWWGCKEGNFDAEYPELAKKYMGLLGGIRMFELYAQAKIVLNDYGMVAGGQGINQRIYEVLGLGTFLLSRESESFKEWSGAICTYADLQDCSNKIIWYLKNESEREIISKKGQQFVLANFNYRMLIKGLSDELINAYNEKFGKERSF